MKFVIDRFEEDKAIIETDCGEMLTIPAALVRTAKEGDTITLSVKTANNVNTHSIFEKLRSKSDNI